MSSEVLGEMFEVYSADTCARKFPLVSMGGQAEGLVCANPELGLSSALAEILKYFSFKGCSKKNLTDQKKLIEIFIFG